MLYKAPGLAAEMLQAHPECRAICHDLDKQLQAWGLGELVVTDIFRNPSFYPETRWSWHYCGGAFDVRTRDFTDTDCARVVAWLQGRCFRSEFKCDVVPEPSAARGPHIHVEVEDWLWRRKWERAQKATT